ncbi:hypothetical protein EG347_17780 [Chryseobacterium sp. G0186]|nr:hypothetical protein EG347_17780 [Chryseobacterium sp. G0186]
MNCSLSFWEIKQENLMIGSEIAKENSTQSDFKEMIKKLQSSFEKNNNRMELSYAIKYPYPLKTIYFNL